jgi:adenylate cyclase
MATLRPANADRFHRPITIVSGLKEKWMARRLAAILATDVVGYSSLMAEDEAGTLAALRAHRQDLFDPETEKRGGRIVKLMGDGALVEFPSVVNAVECAVAIQTALAETSGPIRLRVGINLGDVILDGDDIYGDGVNIAARLEALAETGGICVSGMVYDQVRNKVDLAFDSLGEKRLKNIPEPVRVYRIATGGRSATAFEASIGLDFTVPGYPSIAVLPFTVMSADPEQEFFADGVVEDIITALSKISRLMVVARNSTRGVRLT